MPKKYKHSYPTKPASSAHPSLAPSSSSASRRDGSARATGEPGPEPQNVNDMLTRLRGIHLSATPSAEPHRSVAPSSQPVLLFPPSQHQPGLQQLPPRARMLARVRARPPPGPAAPASWASGNGGITTTMMMTTPSSPTSSSSSSSSPLTANQLEAAAAASSRRIDRLPGLKMPAQGSLVHTLLKKMAMHWPEFVRSEGLALSYVPAHLKKHLLALLVIYGPGLIPPRELRLMCYGDAELYGATGTNGITHVHAAYATGDPGKGGPGGYKDLATLLLGENYLREQRATPSSSTSSTGDLGATGIPESWEDDAESGPDVQAPSASWKYLVKYLTPHLKQLTHLSLAYWPAPSLTTNSRNTVITSSGGSLDSRTLNWQRDERSEDWSEAAGVVQKLGRDLPRLRWLDLEGCSLAGGWVDALRNAGAGAGTGSRRQIDWVGTFRGLETLRIGQGKVPRPLRRCTSLHHFVQEWAAWALLKWPQTPAVKRWLNDAHHRLAVPEDTDFDSHWARSLPFISNPDVQAVYLWLEREARVLAVANHIAALRTDAGVPRKLTVVCTEDAPSWADALVRHPDRGRDVREDEPADFRMLTKILPPDCMNSMLDYLDSIGISKSLTPEH